MLTLARSWVQRSRSQTAFSKNALSVLAHSLSHFSANSGCCVSFQVSDGEPRLVLLLLTQYDILLGCIQPGRACSRNLDYYKRYRRWWSCSRSVRVVWTCTTRKRQTPYQRVISYPVLIIIMTEFYDLTNKTTHLHPAINREHAIRVECTLSWPTWSCYTQTSTLSNQLSFTYLLCPDFVRQGKLSVAGCLSVCLSACPSVQCLPQTHEYSHIIHICYAGFHDIYNRTCHFELKRSKVIASQNSGAKCVTIY